MRAHAAGGLTAFDGFEQCLMHALLPVAMPACLRLPGQQFGGFCLVYTWSQEQHVCLHVQVLGWTQVQQEKDKSAGGFTQLIKVAGALLLLDGFLFVAEQLNYSMLGSQ